MVWEIRLEFFGVFLSAATYTWELSSHSAKVEGVKNAKNIRSEIEV